MEDEPITTTNIEEENKTVSNQKISKKLRKISESTRVRALSGTFEKVRDAFSDLTLARRSTKEKKKPPPKPPHQDLKIEIISSMPQRSLLVPLKMCLKI